MCWAEFPHFAIIGSGCLIFAIYIKNLVGRYIDKEDVKLAFMGEVFVISCVLATVLLFVYGKECI